MQLDGTFSVAGLFAGIGGMELGLQQAGGEARLLCEKWEPAQQVLSHRFPNVPIAGDITELAQLPDVDVLTAGFPCTDLSQAGRTKGITGEASGLVAEVFRLLRSRPAPVVVLENVRNMLVLDKGEAMRYLVDELESLGYRWAYRLVDSRFTGVPQRRQRVILVASREIDPRSVLFADDAGEPKADTYAEQAFGFSWTEGNRGVGWAKDAVPTVKGGSGLGIASPPAIWNPNGTGDRRILTPTVEDAEQLQGFPRGWTSPADNVCRRKGTRWKLVGNAVTVGVLRWIGERLVNPGIVNVDETRLEVGAKWPVAAHGFDGQAWGVEASMWPTSSSYIHLHDLVDFEMANPLSERASKGFLSRAQASSLRFVDGFLDDVEEHVAMMGAKA